MRILIFSTAYLPFVGGAELAIKEITDRLPGISFALITARFKRSVPKHERIGNIDVYRIGLGTPFDKWLLPWLGFRKAKQLELSVSQTNPLEVSLTNGNYKGGFDVIWSMMASQASIAAAWFKKTFPDKKLVLTLQEGDEEEHLKRYVFGIGFLYRLLIRPWHTLVFKRADAITAISNYLAERARKNNATVPITVVPNGVDVKNFQPTTPPANRRAGNNQQRKEIRERLGIRPEDKVVITTSRLVEKNGIRDLIESLRYLPSNVKMLICGDGPLESALKLQTTNYKLQTRVHFLGHVPHEQLPAYLHAADIFCRPSLSEGMGSSFIEAMAAGLPVVATPVGGIVDFLCDPSFSRPDSLRSDLGSEERSDLSPSGRYGQTGLFCRVGDPHDIAAKIQLLLSNAELRNHIIANASKMVREKYGWNTVAEKMKAVFESEQS